MPIDANIFDIARDPSPLVINFLKKNPTKAYTLNEIYDSIKEFRDLKIPKERIQNVLESPALFLEIETAFLNGEMYYKIRRTRLTF